MHAASAVAVAAAFVWLGMVLAISFIETPLKFRAPGVTLQIGLGIGRLVFRALNACELALAAVVVACFAITPPTTASRSRWPSPSSPCWRRCWRCGRGSPVGPTPCLPVGRGHGHGRIGRTSGLEIVKVIALLIAGVSLLAT